MDKDKRAKYDKSGRYEGDGGEEEFDMDDFFKVTPVQPRTCDAAPRAQRTAPTAPTAMTNLNYVGISLHMVGGRHHCHG